MKSTKEEVCSQPHNGVERTNESVGAGKAFRTRRRKGSPVRLRGGTKALPLRGGKTSGGAIRLRNVSQNRELQTLQVECAYSVRARGEERIIRDFNIDEEVTPLHACVDKLSLKAGLGSIIYSDGYGDEDGYQPKDIRKLMCLCNDKYFRDSGGIHHALIFKSEDKKLNRKKCVAAPLLSGSIETKVVHGENRGQRSLAFTLDASFNPTRAVRYYPIGRFFGSHFLSPDCHPPHLPVSLNGEDNLLPFNTSISSYRRGEKSYIKAVFKCLHDMVDVPCAQGELRRLYISPHDQPTTLNKVEIYYDFALENALSVIHSWCKTLVSYSRDAKIRLRNEGLYDIEPDDFNFEGGMLSYHFRLNKVETLVIYAKTHNRVRFEMRYDKPKKDILGDKRSSVGFDELFRKIEHLKARAADRINELFSYMRQHSQHTHVSIANSRVFRRRWFRQLGDTDETHMLLKLLEITGKVDSCSLSKAEKAIVKKASAKLLLRYRRSGRVYVPCQL